MGGNSSCGMRCPGDNSNPAKTRQDKVNYAVSEREDRVKGATTLTRMACCNGMYWAATELY